METGRDSLTLTLREMEDGSWVIFQLPGFTTPAGGAEQGSLDALRAATDTAYFKDGDTLWVKLVVDNAAGLNVQVGTPGAGVSTVGTGPGGAFDAGARLDVSRQVQVSSAPLNEREPRRE